MRENDNRATLTAPHRTNVVALGQRRRPLALRTPEVVRAVGDLDAAELLDELARTQAENARLYARLQDEVERLEQLQARLHATREGLCNGADCGNWHTNSHTVAHRR